MQDNLQLSPIDAAIRLESAVHDLTVGSPVDPYVIDLVEALANACEIAHPNAFKGLAATALQLGPFKRGRPKSPFNESSASTHHLDARSSVPIHKAAFLLRCAHFSLKNRRPLPTHLAEYVSSALNSLAQDCRVGTRPALNHAAERALNLAKWKRGRPSGDIRHGQVDKSGRLLEVDDLTVCVTVERFRQAGYKTSFDDCFAAAAAQFGYTDHTRIRKIYYEKWDPATGTFFPNGKNRDEK